MSPSINCRSLLKDLTSRRGSGHSLKNSIEFPSGSVTMVCVPPGPASGAGAGSDLCRDWVADLKSRGFTEAIAFSTLLVKMQLNWRREGDSNP